MSQQINLFDARFRKPKQHFSAATLLQGLAAVLAVSLAIQALYAYQNRGLQQTLVQAERRTAEQQEVTLRLARELTAQQGGALADELARLEERLAARRTTLAQLEAAAGGDGEHFSPYLAALARRTTHGVWLTGVEIAADSRQLVIRGRALDTELLPAYIGSLRKEEPFHGRSVNELRVASKGERQVEFSMTVPLGKGSL